MINRRGQMYSVTQCSIYLRCICLITSPTEHSHRVCLSSRSPDEPWKCHFPWFTDKKWRYTGWDPLIILAVKALQYPMVPTQFPPYHKSRHATVIPIPEGGTLGRQSVYSQHGQSEQWPPEQLSCGTGQKQRTIPSLRAALHRGGKNDSLLALWLRISVAWGRE